MKSAKAGRKQRRLLSLERHNEEGKVVGGQGLSEAPLTLGLSLNPFLP